MKDPAFYLKHDLDARNDPKLIALRMKRGAAGYGIYWMIVEKLYAESGRLELDYNALAWELHETANDIKVVAEDYDLFYKTDNDKLACRRVDRALSERRDAVRQAREAGRASAAARASQRAFNARSTDPQPGEERRGEEGEKKTTAPSAVDLCGQVDKSVDKYIGHGKPLLEMQFPFGKYRGRRIIDIPADEAAHMLKSDGRISALLRAALSERVKLKESESNGRKR